MNSQHLGEENTPLIPGPDHCYSTTLCKGLLFRVRRGHFCHLTKPWDMLYAKTWQGDGFDANAPKPG